MTGTLVDPETGEVVPTLESCEAVIERGLATFVEVGNALLTIRDRRLYRQSHDTFEDYCRERWGFVASRARQLIGAAESVTAVTVGGGPAPKNEAQARELAPVKDYPEVAAAAMRRAAEKSPTPTARDIRDAVQEVVREEVARAQAVAEQRAEDREALAKLTAAAERAGLDMDEERTQQRGAFARLCRDLAAFPPPAEFIRRQGDHLRARHGEYARAAHEWLSEFVDLWGAR